LTDDRYDRQIHFASIGPSGQAALAQSRVFIVGAGALGTHAASMLARSGVGTITLIDRDYVETSNLHRQVLYTEEDARQMLPKAEAAARHLLKINRSCRVTGIVGELSGDRPPEALLQADLLIDACDNFETRLAINDLSQKYNIPWIYGGVVGASGTTFTIIPGQTPCLSCLLKQMPILAESCDRLGVIAPVVQWVSAHQVAEGLKWLTGNRSAMRRTLLFENLWTNERAAIAVDALKSADCSSCGINRRYPHLKPLSVQPTVLCGRDTVYIHPQQARHPDLEGVKMRLRRRRIAFVDHEMLIQVVWLGHRVVLFYDGRALIHDLNDLDQAQQIYREIVDET
jgi:molybdopterin/thiamine biosynthesis adenylyltransferase